MLALAFVVAALGRSRGAGASPEQGAASSSARAETAGTWYGAPILIADGSALLLTFVAGSVSDADAVAGGLLTLAGTGYLFGGPIVHFAEGRAGRGFLSLGLRAGLPIAGLALGAALSNRDPLSTLGAGVAGFVLAMPAAIALDASVLAWRPRPPSPGQLSRLSPLQNGLLLLPTWDTKNATAGLRVLGSF